MLIWLPILSHTGIPAAFSTKDGFKKLWLGVPVNFTYDPPDIENNFLYWTGETFRQDISGLEYVLNNDIKVAMV